MDKKRLKVKMSRIFKFLKSYNSLKNPIKKYIDEHDWYLWLDTLPEHQTVIWNNSAQSGDDSDFHACDLSSQAQHVECKLPDGNFHPNDVSEDFIVRIQRPKLSGCPEPPPMIRGWLAEGWRDPEQSIVINKDKQLADSEATEPEKFADDPERVAQFQKWNGKREEWRCEELKVRKIITIYNKFYYLYSQMRREAERVELVIADGIIKTRLDNSNELTNYPLLLQRVELIFDSEIPEFKIIQSDSKPEFNSDLLLNCRINKSAIRECREDFETRISFLYDNDEEVSSFFNSISARLEPGGRFTTVCEEFKKINQALVILKRPLLILRNRTTGFAAFIEAINQDLDQNDDQEIPAALANILGFETEPKNRIDNEEMSFFKVGGEDEEVLFSKEANIEQLQIVKKLERSGAVLVQGPPGTGKTHTIANLIGHFLAQGKTVLVTSHTSKALRVLKEKIVSILRPLCVTVFNEEREQLEQCVDAITEYIAANSAEVLAKEAEKLQVMRNEILTRLWGYKKRLLELRKGEYCPVVIGGKDYQVKEAALIVAEQKKGNDWILPPVTPGAVLPLAHDELIRLYKTNISLTGADEAELRTVLPSLDELLTPYEFDHLVAEAAECSLEKYQLQPEYWEPGYQIDADHLQEITSEIRKIVHELDISCEWEKQALEVGFFDVNYLKPWELLLESINSVYDQNALLQPLSIDYMPGIPDELISNSTCEILNDIIAFLKAGKKIGWFTFIQHNDWKEIFQKVKIQKKAPATVAHFEFLAQSIQVELERQMLLNRWEQLISQGAGPSVAELGKNPEKAMRQYCEKISGLLNWYSERFSPLEKQFEIIGFCWDSFLKAQPILTGDASGLRRLVAACNELEPIFAAMQKQLRATAIRTQVDLKAVELENYIDATCTTLALRNLKSALENFDPVQYRKAYERIVELANKTEDLKLRQGYLEKLSKAAPAWAEAVRNRQGIQGLGELPGNPAQAWEWRQLHDELELRNQESMAILQREIDDLGQRLQEVTIRLIEKRTWAKICRTSLAQRQALVGWKQLIKKMGKRTGKRVPIYMEEARKLMPKCQAAVPVWIMPLVRAAENFNPRENKFDVVIIDEASQSDVLALSALYLGKQVIVVGDDQQVSPDAVGQDQEAVQDLIKNYLDDIPGKQLYDGQSSIYDLAKCSFDPVFLKEHFRCVAPIIEFSNRLSYDNRIKPLRDDSEVVIKPPTVAYHVPDGQAVNRINHAEAATVASLLAACIEQPEYVKASFGVIALLGSEQAVVIDDILRKRLSEKEYANRQILCGNSAQFQGDERDVIFISVVDSGKEDGEGPLTLRSGGARDMYRKRYNVAASRARDQMWVIHSLNVDTDLKADDLRFKLISHALNPFSSAARFATVQKAAESEFERLVIKYLIQNGYQVVPQWKVGSYRIDIVVVGRDKKIAIECDGEKFHTDENLVDDMARQAVLERLGWRFIRIRGSQFFRNQEETMKAVLEQLNGYEIYPEDHRESQTVTENELVDRVIRRAEEIRLEWSQEKNK
jgi:very-short-patch-repair endonuclease/flagellar biosynthesis GTPase FlhF